MHHTPILLPSPLFSRRRDLDIAREVIVASLIFFHTARIFDDLGFYVKNEPQAPAVSFMVVFASLWGMPFLFVIAGFAVWHSLQRRGVGAFVRERFQRLCIPMIVGLLLVVPPQTYFELCGNPAYQESYAQFYPRFFGLTITRNFPWIAAATPDPKLFQPGHLWFLLILLISTLLLLPVFHWLRKLNGRQWVARIARFVISPWALSLLALPLAVIEAALGIEMSGGWNSWSYLVLLFYGYLFAADTRFGQVCRRYRINSLTYAVVGSAGGITGFFLLAAHTDPLQAYDLGSVMLRFVKGLVGWYWIVTIWGFLENARSPGPGAKIRRNTAQASRIPQHRRTFWVGVERYANAAVLPFYILHQLVIVAIGFYVVTWNTSAILKFLFISLAGLALTLLLYEILVKRTRLTRFLFGMKSEAVL